MCNEILKILEGPQPLKKEIMKKTIFFQISKSLVESLSAEFLRMGQTQNQKFMFEKPFGTHCGVFKKTGDFTVSVYKKGQRGVCGSVMQFQFLPRSNFELLPGYYRREGTGIHTCLHQLHCAPSLPYEIAAAFVRVVPYALITTKSLVDFAKQKNEIPGKSTCVAHFGSNSTVCAYTAYNEIEKKDLTLNNLLLLKVA